MPNSSASNVEKPQIFRKATRRRFSGEPKIKNLNIGTRDDTNDSFQRQALPIPQLGEDFDPSAEPKNGEEFLMKMLHERNRCPAVVVKPLNNLDGNEKSEQASSAEVYCEPIFIKDNNTECFPSNLRPSTEWKSEQKSTFLAVRDQINALRSELQAANYKTELEPPLTNELSEWNKFCQQNKPLLRTIMRLNQRTLEQLLDMLCEWLREGAGPPLASDDLPDTKESDEKMDQDQEIADEEPVASSSSAAAVAKANEADNAFHLSNSNEWLGYWLYATLACLHLPLEPEVHSTLRCIARICIQLRNRLSAEEKEKANPYNLFICLISRVFDQLDFAEFV